MNPQDGVKYDNKATNGCHFDEGAEYAVDMPSMKSCLENAKIVTEKSEMVESNLHPTTDKSSKVKEMFTMFGDMVERFQENELGTLTANAEGTQQLYTN